MAASDYVPIFFKNRLHLAGRPQMSILPEDGSTKPATMRSVVVLPSRGTKQAKKFPPQRLERNVRDCSRIAIELGN
ncbi:hypothetical protein ABIB00_007885 [Bradyrhizobium sp. LB14.3]